MIFLFHSQVSCTTIRRLCVLRIHVVPCMPYHVVSHAYNHICKHSVPYSCNIIYYTISRVMIISLSWRGRFSLHATRNIILPILRCNWWSHTWWLVVLHSMYILTGSWQCHDTCSSRGTHRVVVCITLFLWMNEERMKERKKERNPWIG